MHYRINPLKLAAQLFVEHCNCIFEYGRCVKTRPAENLLVEVCRCILNMAAVLMHDRQKLSLLRAAADLKHAQK